MSFSRKMRRSIVFAIIALVVFLGILQCLDHHACTDRNCVICNLLSALRLRSYCAVDRFGLSIWTLAALLTAFLNTFFFLFSSTPVKQKVKISC